VYCGGLLSEEAKEMLGDKEEDSNELDVTTLDEAIDIDMLELIGV
jgi:hypothetical protein